MEIREITVHAGRTFNNPHESYANLKPGLSIRATLEPGEDAEAAVKALQAKAETLMERHKGELLRQLEEAQEMKNAEYEIHRLQRVVRDQTGNVATAESRLAELKSKFPELSTLAIECDTEDDPGF